MANKAFIIGINTLGLQYCNCDADLMSECLGKYGYEIIKPRSIKSEINTQLDIMVDTCQKTDTTILYFSGHGLVEKDKLFFVLADDATRAGNRININELIETFSDCRANNKLVILDCCNAGIGYADWRPDISDRYLILTASDRLEKSKELDVLKASFLTHILHQTLSTPPFKIVNAENKIYVVALYDWLVEATKQHNSIKNSIQVPIPNLLGNQKANFEVATLITPPSSTPKIDPGEVQLKQKAEQRYRELALESCDIIDLATLPQEDPHIATRELELRRLYVPLHVRVEVTSSDAGDEATFVAIEKRRHLSLSGRHQREEQGERVPVGERLAKAHRLVVLGDPGAGKSTMLRWIATAYLLRLKQDPDWQSLPAVTTLPDENWLPVIIRCRDLDAACLNGSLDDMLHRTFRKAEMTMPESDALKEVIQEKLKTGQALLLIDGLDEITIPAARIRFCQQIEQVDRAYPDVSLIVTSRIVGYREMSYRIKRGFEHVTLADLSSEDKDDFTRRWCAITEPPERRAKATSELIRDIHSTDRIERLTGNPMLLTTMALVKRKVGKLPTRRGGLYAEAVRVLLNWRREVDEPIDDREAEPQLQYVAYAMCDRFPSVQQLREDEIVELLTTMRQDYPNVHALKNHTPEDFLHLLERRTGILVEAGRVPYQGQEMPVFEFRHLTFQEYLAGLALVKGYFPNRDRSRSLPDYIAPLAGRTSEVEGEVVVTENWREALRLCVAACGDDDVDDVLKAILTPLPGEEAAITARPRAVLATLCLADEPNASETMVDRILQTFAWQVNKGDGEGSISSSLDAAAIELATSRWGQRLRAYLVQEFSNRDRDARTRLSAGGLCAMAITATIPQAEGGVQAWLAEQATHLTSGTEATAIEAALGIMELAFERKNNVPPEITAVAGSLMAMLRGSAPAGCASAWALNWLNDGQMKDKAWRPSTIDREPMITLVSDPAADVGAVRFLAFILGRDHDARAVEPLLARLDDPTPEVCEAVAWALGQLSDARAVEPLLAHLDDPAPEVRQAVAESLGRLSDARAISILTGRLSASDSTIRREALAGLAQTCQNEIDRKLLSRDIDALHPFWDPQEEIGKSQLREAMERLNLSIEEIQRRYEALAHRFQLKLAWQANTPATPNP